MATPEPKFKAGDKVRVVLSNSHNSEAMYSAGRICTIKDSRYYDSINVLCYHLVEDPYNICWYDYNLELVSSKEMTYGIKKVIYNNPATIILWADGTKTVVKVQDGDTYSKELGFAMCVSKKYFGNQSNFNNVFKKYVYDKE